MPMVEVLSNSAASGAYWTYTTAPPAHAVGTAPTLASTGRGGRTTRQAQHTHSIENSAARQRQVASRLLDLERDNYRDVAIPIPKKDQFHGHQRAQHRSTQNVRRILSSQKTWANHLADEEALHPARRGGSVISSRTSSPSRSPSYDADERMLSPPPTSPITKATEEEDDDDDEGSGNRSLDGGRPLGYARTAAKPSLRPPRRFCEMCGYWGTYRCGKCAARYCSLNCQKAHQEVRCSKFYA